MTRAITPRASAKCSRGLCTRVLSCSCPPALKSKSALLTQQGVPGSRGSPLKRPQASGLVDTLHCSTPSKGASKSGTKRRRLHKPLHAAGCLSGRRERGQAARPAGWGRGVNQLCLLRGWRHRLPQWPPWKSASSAASRLGPRVCVISDSSASQPMATTLLYCVFCVC